MDIHTASSLDTAGHKAFADKTARPETPGAGNARATQGTGAPPSAEDFEATRLATIAQLARHGLALQWTVLGEPSDAVKDTVEGYLVAPEVDETLSEWARAYVMKLLAHDLLVSAGWGLRHAPYGETSPSA